MTQQSPLSAALGQIPAQPSNEPGAAFFAQYSIDPAKWEAFDPQIKNMLFTQHQAGDPTKMVAKTYQTLIATMAPTPAPVVEPVAVPEPVPTPVEFSAPEPEPEPEPEPAPAPAPAPVTEHGVAPKKRGRPAGSTNKGMTKADRLKIICACASGGLTVGQCREYLEEFGA